MVALFEGRRVVAMSSFATFPQHHSDDAPKHDLVSLMRSGARLAGVAFAIGTVSPNSCGWRIRLSGVESRMLGGCPIRLGGEPNEDAKPDEKELLLWAADLLMSMGTPVIVTAGGRSDPLAFLRYRCLQARIPLPELVRPDRPCRSLVYQDHLELSDGLALHRGRSRRPTLTDLATRFHLPNPLPDDPEVHIQSRAVLIYLLAIHWLWLVGYADGREFSDALLDAQETVRRHEALGPLWPEWRVQESFNT